MFFGSVQQFAECRGIPGGRSVGRRSAAAAKAEPRVGKGVGFSGAGKMVRGAKGAGLRRLFWRRLGGNITNGEASIHRLGVASELPRETGSIGGAFARYSLAGGGPTAFDPRFSGGCGRGG